jgi:predicted RNase H-like HicB family nuclease
MNYRMLSYCVGDIDGYAVMVHDDPDGSVRWAASLRAVPGCISQGDTQEEAVARLRATWPNFRAFLERYGCDIPEPDPPITTIGYAEWAT